MKQYRILFVFVIGLLASASEASLTTGDSTEARDTRALELKNLSPKDMIVYGPKNPKAIVTVFTDLNCGFCRKLHHDIARLEELGIQLRYMAFPRQGMGSPDYNKMVSIWCMEDPKAAMNIAMQGEYFQSKVCDNPIQSQFLLGRKWGIAGTPTLVFSDGSLRGGYMSPERLAKEAIKRGGG